MSKYKEHPDEDFVIPFGEHKGTKLKNLPDDYLYYLTSINTFGALKRYLTDNYDAIVANVNRGKYYNKVE